ncbi:DNA repair protein RecN [Acidocella aromatica]|uniref:DNA repair protein RecN n=1 Tax=Acidocella aromatica TaxID=1303579 RepID=A0A840VSU4_9PROT|nr:DNA repair protein RecN [Acidocella aromatica]MBB5373292.1 DNA repair protein RecN (Recombination protein N) [Acidocella aromatica]
MLNSLSIRDVVLIERLDLHFDAGLTALTGETGAGKSILLDSLGLALGARADAGLIRAGTEQAVVAASFSVGDGHAAQVLLNEHGLDSGAEILVRRIVARDGRSRALVNDQPVSVGFLKKLAGLLIEVQGQHEQVGLADPANHIFLLDAFGVPPAPREAVAAAHKAWRDAAVRLKEAERRIEESAREEDFLRHAADELAKLNPVHGEEEALAAERLRLQAGERRAEAIASAISELRPKDRRASGPAAALRAAARALARVTVPAGHVNPAGPAMAALERAEIALAEAEDFMERLAASEEDDPRALEATEERLFALRAAARKHGVQVAELPEFYAALRAKLAALESGVADIAALTAETARLRATYVEKAATLSALREDAAKRLEAAISSELPPLKLERARFVVERTMLPEAQWGPRGADAVRFLIATNPGEAPGALDKIASGGELSRLMLAMKVVLTGGGSVETLIFDEVDSGIGGATAAAVGERLARVARNVQVLVVTHSPQVAARGAAQLRVAKRVVAERALTDVEVLDEDARREEIARMLAGEVITDAARQAAESLLRI